MVVTTTSAAASRSRRSIGLVRVGERVEPLLLEAQHPGVHLLEEVLLGAEVVVERALGDARRLDDLLHGGAVVAVLREQAGGGGEQPLGDGRGAARVRRLGHRRHLSVVLARGALPPPCACRAVPVVPRRPAVHADPLLGRYARSRSSRLRIFPLVVLGSSVRISTSRGYL